MKRIIFLLICLIFVFTLCACGGDMKNVKTHEVVSELYSQDEISSAIAVITEEFDKEWKGCSLTEIYYGGDEKTKDYQGWANRNNADDVIVLLSSFDVDSSGGEGLDPNSTYKDWMWILVRTANGQWKHVDHGY